MNAVLPFCHETTVNWAEMCTLHGVGATWYRCVKEAEPPTKSSEGKSIISLNSLPSSNDSLVLPINRPSTRNREPVVSSTIVDRSILLRRGQSCACCSPRALLSLLVLPLAKCGRELLSRAV